MGLIFRTLHEEGPLSRTSLVERTGLAPSTVSVITAELQARKFIRERGRDAETRIGRPQVLLEVNPTGGYFLSADLGSDGLAVAVIDLSLEPVLSKVYRTDSTLQGEELYRQLIRALNDLQDTCTFQKWPVLGIGVASPGLITPTGRVLQADNLGWIDFDLKARLESDISEMVVVENDSNAAASGEFRHGSYRDVSVQNMMYVSVDTGIGCGLILDGELFSGTHGLAGEFGHIVVMPDGPRCACGGRGCLEAVAAGPALLRDYWNISGSGSVREVADLTRQANRGDENAIGVLVEGARRIGTAIGNQINVLNVDTVVLGGSVVLGCDAFFFDEVERAARRVTLPRFGETVTFRRSSLGTNAGLVGSASLCLLQLFRVSA